MGPIGKARGEEETTGNKSWKSNNNFIIIEN